MQAWDSVIVKADADSPYAGTAGCVVTVTKGGDGAVISALVRMDKDGAEVTFPAAQLQRLG